MANYQREVAYKIKISSLIKGKYVTNEGNESNFIQVNGKNISRVNIIGFVTDVSSNNYTIDDSYGEVVLRDFNNIGQDVSVGDLVLVIGRPRSFNDEVYIVPEIIKKQENQDWMILRKKELDSETETIVEDSPKEDKKSEEKEYVVNSEDKGSMIKNVIAKHDSGDGVSLQKIIEELNDSETESMVKQLLKEGEIYEIKPNVLKIL